MDVLFTCVDPECDIVGKLRGVLFCMPEGRCPRPIFSNLVVEFQSPRPPPFSRSHIDYVTVSKKKIQFLLTISRSV